MTGYTLIMGTLETYLVCMLTNSNTKVGALNFTTFNGGLPKNRVETGVGVTLIQPSWISLWKTISKDIGSY